MQLANAMQREFEEPAMMEAVPQTGTPVQDPHVPMPSPLRALLYIILASLLAAAVYFCIETAVMIYDWYQIIQWLGALAEHS